MDKSLLAVGKFLKEQGYVALIEDRQFIHIRPSGSQRSVFIGVFGEKAKVGGGKSFSRCYREFDLKDPDSLLAIIEAIEECRSDIHCDTCSHKCS